MEPAWALLKAQKPYVGVVVTTSAEAAPHFENGEVWVSPYWSARAGYYISRGLPYGMTVPKEGVIANIDSASVPVGAKNKKLAYEFINFWLEPAMQRAWSIAYFCSPGRGDIGDWPKGFAESQIVTHEAVRPGEAARPRRDRRQSQGLDAEVAGDHGDKPMKKVSAESAMTKRRRRTFFIGDESGVRLGAALRRPPATARENERRASDVANPGGGPIDGRRAPRRPGC